MSLAKNQPIVGNLHFGRALVLGCAATLLHVFLYEPLGKEVAMKIAVAGMALVIGCFFRAGFEPGLVRAVTKNLLAGGRN